MTRCKHSFKVLEENNAVEVQSLFNVDKLHSIKNITKKVRQLL